MTFEPLLQSSFIIQLHVAAACVALLAGPLALWRRSRDHWHRRLGYLWVVAMAMTALSSFGISGFRVFGPFSPIHVLSAYTLWSLWYGVRFARLGRIAAHQAQMKTLYLWAIGVTGVFTLLPGRLMNKVLLGGTAGWSIAALAIAVGLLLGIVYRKRFLPLGKPRGLF